MPSGPKIFVSYTVRDGLVTIAELSLLYKKLRQLGTIYIDLLHNDSEDKQRRVKRELLSSDIVLLLVTPAVSSSPWVAWELKIARQKSIPVYFASYLPICRGTIIDTFLLQQTISMKCVQSAKELSA